MIVYNICRLFFKFFCLTVLFIFQTDGRNWGHLKKKVNKNFVSVRYNNSNHERELRIAFKGILMMETTAYMDSEYKITLHQITDGEKLIQSVSQNGELKDCDFSIEEETIMNFVRGFASDSNVFSRTGNGNVFEMYNRPVSWTSNTTSALQFFRHRKFLKQFKNLIKVKRSTKSCHKIANKVKKMYELYKKHPIASMLKGSSGRRKRSVFASFLMYPGTKWCGRGQLAREYDELGKDNELDTCCRDHDLCNLIIEPFSWKFNYFNYRFHAVLHCKCDEEFRHCLQQSLSPNANFVGKIYFNIMGSKCFVLREMPICTKHTWWGRCAAYKTDLVAHIKTQRYFTYT